MDLEKHHQSIQGKLEHHLSKLNERLDTIDERLDKANEALIKVYNKLGMWEEK